MPVEILALGDRPPAVGDVAEAKVPVGEPDQTLLGQLCQKCRAERPVQQRVRLLRRADDERKVDQPEFLDDPDEGGGRRRLHLLRPAAQCGLLLHLAAELVRWKLPDLELAAALRGDDLGELLHAHAHRMIRVVQVPPADGALLDILRRLAGTALKRTAGDSGGNNDGTTDSRSSPRAV